MVFCWLLGVSRQLLSGCLGVAGWLLRLQRSYMVVKLLLGGAKVCLYKVCLYKVDVCTGVHNKVDDECRCISVGAKMSSGQS